jgi:hypothetical protein
VRRGERIMIAASPNGDLVAESAFSLTLAVRDVARRAGHEIDIDDLHAALGLSFMLCASREEPPGVWPTLARDAFLVEAARLFGMGIRDVHPPEAARGLDRAEEFRQHFDASYRPLIHRALENDQPVLAWRGWTGARAGLWGVMTGTCDGGIGFTGRAFGTGGEDATALSRPPVQLYVVETLDFESAAPADLLESVTAHAAAVLRNGLSDPFAVLTGPAAYALWAARLADLKPSEPGAARGLADHRGLARSVTASYRSGLRFCGKWLDRCPADKRGALQHLQAGCEGMVDLLMDYSVQNDAVSGRHGDEWVAGLAAAVAQAQEITAATLDALKESRPA